METPPPDMVQEVLVLLTTGRDRDQIGQQIRARFLISEERAEAVLDEATRRLTEVAAFHRDAELGRALIRLNDCYERAIAADDIKTAVNTQKELNRLLSLYKTTDPEKDYAPSAEGTELASIRSHLERLFSGSAETPTEELARRLAEELCRYRYAT